MARYGSQKIPFHEDMDPKPIDPYGISKVAAEKVLINLCDLNNIEWIIAVPHNIIGPRQKYDDPFRNVVSIMLNRMIQNKAPIIYGDGKQKRCFSYIDDCLTCLIPMVDQKNLNKQLVSQPASQPVSQASQPASQSARQPASQLASQACQQQQQPVLMRLGFCFVLPGGLLCVVIS